MWRRLLDFLTLLSLLLSVGVVAVSLLSCITSAGHDRRRPSWRGGFSLRDGELSVWRQTAPRPKDLAAFRLYVVSPSRQWAGLEYRSGKRGGVSWWDVRLPFWWLLAITGFVPACRLAARRRLVRRHDVRVVRSLCHSCGYDLRGSLTDICSECGTSKGASPLAPGLP